MSRLLQRGQARTSQTTGGPGLAGRALFLNQKLRTENSSHAGTVPPTVVFGGIGGEYGADGTLGAITGWKRR